MTTLIPKHSWNQKLPTAALRSISIRPTIQLGSSCPKRSSKRRYGWLNDTIYGCFATKLYEELYFSETPPHPVWTYPKARKRAIALHTLSKTYGMAGARVGFAHGPRDVMNVIRNMQTFHTYCAPKPMQIGAIMALTQGAQWTAESRTLYQKAGQMAANALGIPAPQSGTFVFADVSHLLSPDDVDCMPFLRECADRGVLLAPGRSCGVDYSKWVRMCFTAIAPDELECALQQITSILKEPG